MIVQRDLGALSATVVFRLSAAVLAPLLVVFGLFATVVALSSGATAAPAYGYDAQIHAYDAAANSVQLHTSAAAAVVSQDGFDDPDGTVAQATGPLSVLLSLSVAADSEASLFRGVGTDHVGYADALEGTAKPWGGPASAEEHNLGDTNSPYTSWTTDLGVAQAKAGDGGVVLRIPQAPRAGNSFTWSPDWYDESEVLIEGTVTGAEVLP